MQEHACKSMCALTIINVCISDLQVLNDLLIQLYIFLIYNEHGVKHTYLNCYERVGATWLHIMLIIGQHMG